MNAVKTIIAAIVLVTTTAVRSEIVMAVAMPRMHSYCSGHFNRKFWDGLMKGYE